MSPICPPPDGTNLKGWIPYGYFSVHADSFRSEKQEGGEGKLITTGPWGAPNAGGADYCCAKGSGKNDAPRSGSGWRRDQRINLAPGMVLAPLTSRPLTDPEAREKQTAKTPMARRTGRGRSSCCILPLKIPITCVGSLRMVDAKCRSGA